MQCDLQIAVLFLKMYLWYYKIHDKITGSVCYIEKLLTLLSDCVHCVMLQSIEMAACDWSGDPCSDPGWKQTLLWSRYYVCCSCKPAGGGIWCSSPRDATSRYQTFQLLFKCGIFQTSGNVLKSEMFQIEIVLEIYSV